MNELIMNQDTLSNICDSIETYQNELDMNINQLTNGLEAEWEQINKQEGCQVLSGCDKDRENTFTLVTQLEYQLLKMQSNVQSLSTKYKQHSDEEESKNDSNNTIPQIVNILEHFQNSIDYLTATSKNLQKEVNKIKVDLM